MFAWGSCCVVNSSGAATMDKAEAALSGAHGYNIPELPLFDKQPWLKPSTLEGFPGCATLKIS
jgi:hypothetical protein